MSNNRYAAFFAAYNSSVKRGNPLSREEQISEFTGGRTQSLKELNAWELNELTMRLNKSAIVSTSLNERKALPAAERSRSDRMRKAIIAIFHKMDRPPAAAIAWAEKQGVTSTSLSNRGEHVKKRFNDYSNQELYQLILRAEKALADYQMGIRKGFASACFDSAQQPSRSNH